MQINKTLTAVIELYRAYLTGSAPKSLTLCGINPKELYEAAANHQIVPMIYKILRETEYFASLPERERRRWKTISISTVAIQAHRDIRMWEVYEALRAAKIKALMMKGVTLRTVYPDPDLRLSSDEDIWISPDDFEKCDRIIEQMGFKHLYGNKKALHLENDIGYIDNQSALYIELHTNPIATMYKSKTNAMLNENVLELFGQSREYSFSAHTFEALAPTENLILIHSHFLQHFLCRGASVRMLTDTVLYMNRYKEEIDFERFDRFLESGKSVRLFGALCTIAYDRLGLEPNPRYHSDERDGTDELLSDIAFSGAFGNFSEAHNKSALITVRTASDIKSGKKPVFWTALFPPYNFLLAKYPPLQKHCWLIPYFWVHRIFAFVFGSSLRIKLDAYRTGRRRTKLFERFGII